MDKRDFTIGVLSITAVILLVGLIMVNTAARPAFADAGVGVESGDYVLATGAHRIDEDLLYVVDCVAQRLIVYRFDVDTWQNFSPTDGVDLAAVKQQGPGAAIPEQPRGGRRGGRYP